MEGLGFTDVASLKSLGLILEDGHGRKHAPEAKPSIERLFAGDRVQNDLLVPVRELDELGDDLLADARSLMGWKNRYIADVRTVRSVRKRSPSADQSSLLPCEAAVAAVREDSLETCSDLVSERSRMIKRLEFAPVDAGGDV